jgi:hypothetical protein
LIECVFTLDYEIYGNGTGALNELVYEPGQKLKSIFQQWGVQFVAFVEVAEFEQIERFGTDDSIHLVKRQIQSFHDDGFEVALHLHPQWYNARYVQGRWQLDYNEYNLCTLPRTRITDIVDRALDYLRRLLCQSEFTPLSFRAGNWLFQPTEAAASVMAERGIKVDSSVFKGGVQHDHRLDYRPALKNGYYWSFTDDVTKPDKAGPWIEVPIHTEMVLPWRMTTRKRLGFGHKFGISGDGIRRRSNRIRDFLRFRYPLKLDFCRMTEEELRGMMNKLIEEDRESPDVYRPIVAIGHTKDFVDPDTVEKFLRFLSANEITVCTFDAVHRRVEREKRELVSNMHKEIRLS